MIKQSHFWNLPIVHKGMLQKSDTEVDISSEGGDINFSHSLYHEGAFAPESLWFLVLGGLSSSLWAVPEMMQAHKP